MKTFCAAIAFGLLGLLPPCCSAQEVKTVAQCRAYREAWVTSADTDIKNLAVRELLHRAEQMTACAKHIDAKPFEADVTCTKALDIAIGHSAYAILAVAYYQEAFDRAARYMEKKGLSKEFIAADGGDKTVTDGHEQ
jgi:hypothetical protein